MVKNDIKMDLILTETWPNSQKAEMTLFEIQTRDGHTDSPCEDLIASPLP